MILVCGLLDEPVIESFLTYLTINQKPFIFLEERDLGKNVLLKYNIKGNLIEGEIIFGKWSIDIQTISGIYNRLGMMKSSPSSHRYRNSLKSLEYLLNIFPGKVANRPFASESNSSKPSQYKAILHSGLSLPDSYLGFSSEELRVFKDKQGKIIVKSTSSIRSIVKVFDDNEFAGIENCDLIIPHQYQACLKGINVRVHVIGDHVFSCEMITNTLDYRYSGKFGEKISFNIIELPKAIADACLSINKTLNLSFSGIDLFRTTNKWYCFEVNTCPGYTWFEEHTGLPISENLSNYLLL